MSGVCANVCTNYIMINRNASCCVSIIYTSTWLLRVFFAVCLRAWCPLYIKILRFKRVLFLQIYNYTTFIFKPFCVRTQTLILVIYIQRVQLHTLYCALLLASPPPPPFSCHGVGGCTPPNFFIFFIFHNGITQSTRSTNLADLNRYREFSNKINNQ